MCPLKLAKGGDGPWMSTLVPTRVCARPLGSRMVLWQEEKEALWGHPYEFKPWALSMQEAGVSSGPGGAPAGMNEEGVQCWRGCHGRREGQARLPWALNLASWVSSEAKMLCLELRATTQTLPGRPARAFSSFLTEQRPGQDALVVVELRSSWGVFLRATGGYKGCRWLGPVVDGDGHCGLQPQRPHPITGREEGGRGRLAGVTGNGGRCLH